MNSMSPAEVSRLAVLHGENRTLAEIAAALSDEFGHHRAKVTVERHVKRNGLRNKRSRRTPEIDARMAAIFATGATGEAAAAILRAEFGFHLSPDGIRTAWRRMGLRRPRRPMPERWRGKLPIPEHAHPLVRQFIKEMNAQNTTFAEIAARVGLERLTISAWGRRRTPSLANFEAALNVLDLELVIQPRKESR